MNDKLVVVDCGKNNSTLYKNGKIYSYSHADLLDKILELPDGTKVVSEEAHLGTARKGLSKSQPYTAEELLEFYDTCKDNGIEMRFFPQQSTFRAQQYYRTKYNLSEDDFPKSDENDPKAIYELLADHGEISLSSPKINFDEDAVRKEGYDFKNSLNTHLNHARASEPKPYAYEDDGCRRWIDGNIDELASQIHTQEQEAFGLSESSRYKKNNKINLNKIRMTQLYSIVSTLVDYHGEKRYRESTGALPGWRFIRKYIIPMSPFHRRGGVARSNLYHHGLKNYLKAQVKINGIDPLPKGGRGTFSKDQDIFFRKHRIIYCNSIRKIFQVCRKMLED
jgi:hypothetical protein